MLSEMKRLSETAVLVSTMLALSACGASHKVVNADAVITAPTCRVTLPNHQSPPGERPDPLDYGNGVLWTALWRHGVVLARPADVVKGAVEAKFGFWRGVKGQLHVTGERLDGPAPALKADIPQGYGSSGFQATGLTFPTDGCWKVTASVAGHRLSFVTIVVRIDKRWFDAGITR
jgi:hypothetical protein